MSYTCPVCKTNYEAPQDCGACGFAAPSRLFLSEPDAKKWLNVEVLPRRTAWKTSELEERILKLEELAKSRDVGISKLWTELKALTESHNDEIQKLRAENKKLEKRLQELPKQSPAPQPAMPKSGDTKIDARIGGTIPFGKYQWRVLDVQNGKTLILSEKIMKLKQYHNEWQIITWEECTLRQYLNGELLNSFSAEEKARIAETRIPNNDNQWYGTKGGNATKDNIFLLSIEEVMEYFGNSGQLRNRPSKDTYHIDDQYNFARMAMDTGGAASWWWLRSPGGGGSHAAGVSSGGGVDVFGNLVYVLSAGVRPALWLDL